MPEPKVLSTTISVLSVEEALKQLPILSVEFIRTGGVSGMPNGWRITTEKTSEPRQTYGVELLNAENIHGETIIDEVKALVKLDRSKSARNTQITDLFEYTFRIQFADGTQITSWIEEDISDRSSADMFKNSGDAIRKKLTEKSYFPNTFNEQ